MRSGWRARRVLEPAWGSASFALSPLSHHLPTELGEGLRARAELRERRRGLVHGALDRPDVNVVDTADEVAARARREVRGRERRPAARASESVTQVAQDRVGFGDRGAIRLDEQRHFALRVQREVLRGLEATERHRRHHVDEVLDASVVKEHPNACAVV